MINKNKFKRGAQFKKYRVRRPVDNKRKQMLDMGRQRYFRMDLEDLLTGFELGENKTIVAATILNKMTSHSMDDAFEYIGRLKTAEKLSGEKADSLKGLLQRYSRWR